MTSGPLIPPIVLYRTRGVTRIMRGSRSSPFAMAADDEAADEDREVRSARGRVWGVGDRSLGDGVCARSIRRSNCGGEEWGMSVAGSLVGLWKVVEACHEARHAKHLDFTDICIDLHVSHDCTTQRCKWPEAGSASHWAHTGSHLEPTVKTTHWT